jgi:hypothetical protein
MAVYSQLTLRAQQHYAYISPLLAILAVASATVAIFSFFVNRKSAKMKAASVESIVADMDTIYRPYMIADAQRTPPEGPNGEISTPLSLQAGEESLQTAEQHTDGAHADGGRGGSSPS